MTDSEFLDYCAAMTETERCGFTPTNIARLLRLAGHVDAAKRWEREPPGVVSNCHEAISRHVAEARAALAGGPVNE